MNAASDSMRWVMTNVLPQQMGLEVTNILYRYTAVKDPNTGMIVYVQNEDAANKGEYIFRSVDDWTGLPGNTIVKSIPIDAILGSRFGDGEIKIEGEGTVEDPFVIYSYRFDPCFNPQSSPSCEGYIPDIPEVPQVENPLDENYVQDELDRKAVMRSEEDEEEEREAVEKGAEEDPDEESLEERLGIAIQSALAATDRAAEMANSIPAAYTIALPTTEYKETVTISDNKAVAKALVSRRGLGLAQDKLHQELVRSQFER